MQRTLTCRPVLWVGWVLVTSATAWANSAPVVSNVTASQRTDGSKLVDIYYNLADADGGACTVTVQASDGGGATWDVAITAVSGAVGSGITPGTGKHIIWNSATDLPGAFGSQYKVRVCADDTECVWNRDCDDANRCTDDACVGGTCEYTNNTDSCDDGDNCTENDICSNGVCVGFPVECGEGYTCNPDTGNCEPAAAAGTGVGAILIRQVHDPSGEGRGSASTWWAGQLCTAVMLASPSMAPANTGCADSPTFVIDNRGAGLRVVSLVPRYEAVFAEGVEVINAVTATIDWGEHAPSYVVFGLNGDTTEVPAAGGTVQTTLNMGTDLLYSRAGERNELTAYAVSADGATSASHRLYCWGLALPEWAISLKTKKNLGFRLEPLTGKLTFYGEVELLDAGVKGTVNVPQRIPEVGGKWGVEIDPLKFAWELAAQPRFGGGAGLTGTFNLGGTWGAEAACGSKREFSLSATLSGAGEFYPEFRLSDVSAELAGDFTFLLPRVPLLCQWTGCCHTGYCPYFQASIKPEVVGVVGMEEGEPELIAGLKFKNATLDISVTLAGTVGAGSEGSIYYIAGTIGGKPYLVLQFPGDPDSACLNEYVQEVGFDLEARFVVECFWWKVEEEWVFNIFQCPDGKRYLVGTPKRGERRVELVDRAYLDDPEGYCVFPEPTEESGLRSVPGLPDPILNVGTGPTPALAATSDEGLLLFVYDDAGKPTGQHQEIYYARWNGAAWTAHAPLTSNTNPDVEPVAAIDSNGTELAVWVTGAEPTGAETGPRDVLAGFEIAYSIYEANSNAWSPPQPMTSNGYADFLPWFDNSGPPRTCWISSTTNGIPVWHDEEIVPSLDVMAADWDGSAFGAPYAVAVGLSAVSPPAVVRTPSHEFLAYVLDVDWNSGTAEDREVVVRTRLHGQSWGPDVQLTSDLESDSAVQMAIDSNGLPLLTWIKRMVPVSLPDDEETHVDQLWFAAWDGVDWSTPMLAVETEGITEPKLIQNEAGKLVLFWVAASAEFSDIYYSVYDADLSLWGPPQQVTHDEGAETMISLAVSGGNVLAGYVKRRVDLATSNGVPEIGLSDIYLMEHVPQKDLYASADDFSFDPDPVNAGTNATVCVDVRVSGDFTVEDVAVEFYEGAVGTNGTLLGTDTITRLLPGESKPACFVWDVPTNGLRQELFAVVDPDNLILETDDTENNVTSIGVFQPDLRISAPAVTAYPGPDTILAGCTVRNDGSAIAGPSTLQVRKDSPEGDLVFAMPLPGIEVGDSSSVQFAWDVSTIGLGTYTLVFLADAADVVEESNEGNNISTTGVPVLGDLQVEQWSAVCTNGVAEVRVRNVGAKPMAASVARATQGEQTFGEAVVPAMSAGESADISITLTQAVPAGWLTTTVNPDSDGSDEVTLLNNTATAAVNASGDMDGDGDIDLDDYVSFADCLAGPGAPPAPTPPATVNECLNAFDFDADDDVDLSDFAAFQIAFTGSVN